MTTKSLSRFWVRSIKWIMGKKNEIKRRSSIPKTITITAYAITVVMTILYWITFCIIYSLNLTDKFIKAYLI